MKEIDYELMTKIILKFITLSEEEKDEVLKKFQEISKG